MSFILDALKKSERERERQQQPALVEIPYGQRNRKQPLWLLIVIGLLLLNCVLLVLMWWRSSSAPPAATPTVASASPTSSSANSSQGVARTVVAPRPTEVRPLEEEASEPEPLDETAATLAEETPPTGPPLVRPTTGLERAMAQQETQANSAKLESLGRSTVGGGTNPTRTTTDVPTLETLGGSGTLNLPTMRLDVHVYSSVAAERFAFINGHKYQEGQTLSEGPALERITQDGVVLNYRGQRFLLPRQ